jgi:multiple sugar transport system ATP-binding protein
MNFFEARLNGDGDVVSLQADSVRLDLPPERSTLLSGYRNQEIIVGIRPEDLKVTAEHTEGKTLQGSVEVVEPIGNETYVDFNAGSFSLIAAVGRKSGIKAHSNLVVTPAMENLHLFDAESEKAIR